MSKKWTNGVQLSDRVENIMGKKKEIAHYEQFLLSHNVFKSCLLLMRQNVSLWSKGFIDSLLFYSAFNNISVSYKVKKAFIELMCFLDITIPSVFSKSFDPYGH